MLKGNMDKNKALPINFCQTTLTKMSKQMYITILLGKKQYVEVFYLFFIKNYFLVNKIIRKRESYWRDLTIYLQSIENDLSFYIETVSVSVNTKFTRMIVWHDSNIIYLN